MGNGVLKAPFVVERTWASAEEMERNYFQFSAVDVWACVFSAQGADEIEQKPLNLIV